MKLLGIDPGTICTGYAVIQGEQVLDYGTIRPDQKDKQRRYWLLYRGVLELVRNHAIEAVAVETQYVHRNVQSALKLGMARGAIIAAAIEGGASISEYNPTRVKLAVTGRGNATKYQVALMLQKIYALPLLPTPEDASDALALATCLRFTAPKRSA
jgi:crossover junction endodeoxyribonuclease RuvC